ncbi:hypothetical protein C8R43DRAFT_996655 [Mycena crocata]|nr:hypothetical protein C8R43DRAFT_996655 [Mycena crocata]
MQPAMFRSLLCSAAISLSYVATALEQRIFSAPPLETHGFVHRFTPESTKALSDVLGIAQAHDLDIWQISSGSNLHVDIYSPPSSADLPRSLLATPHSLSNISFPASSTPTQLRAPADWDLSSLANSTFHAEYHPQWEVDAFIERLARLRPDAVSILRLGHSAEGREMLGMKIAGPASGTGVPKLGFVVLGPQHAREWVATSTALYITHALLANASEPNSLAHLLDIYDFHIIPSPNPDGYVYTWEADRFWYKNRQIVGPNAQCIGIDMNRNWGYHWKPHAKHPLLWDMDDEDDVAEASKDDLGKNKKNKKKKKKKQEPADPCSHWYPGHRAFEAPEVNNLANYITAVNGVGKGAGKGEGGIAAFFDLRSYGQMLATPFSYKCDKMPRDAEDQMEALLGTAQAAKAMYGTPFTTGSLCELLYRAPGNILDYVYKTASIKYTYAAFLRDTGTYGFALPAAWIRPVGEEAGSMVDYLAGFIAKQRGI